MTKQILLSDRSKTISVLKKTTMAVALVSLASIVIACAGHRAEITESRNISVVIFPKDRVTVRNVKIYEADSGVTIVGRIRRYRRFHRPGHIEITICSQNGDLIAQKRFLIPGLHAKRGSLIEAPFRVNINAKPRARSKVKLRYHAVSNVQNYPPDCT